MKHVDIWPYWGVMIKAISLLCVKWCDWSMHHIIAWSRSSSVCLSWLLQLSFLKTNLHHIIIWNWRLSVPKAVQSTCWEVNINYHTLPVDLLWRKPQKLLPDRTFRVQSLRSWLCFYSFRSPYGHCKETIDAAESMARKRAKKTPYIDNKVSLVRVNNGIKAVL